MVNELDKWLSRWRMYIAIIVMIIAVFVGSVIGYAIILAGGFGGGLILTILMALSGVAILVMALIILGYLLLRIPRKKPHKRK
jgi:uncharacterized membrane protein